METPFDKIMRQMSQTQVFPIDLQPIDPKLAAKPKRKAAPAKRK